jgi:hypothetical protein
MKLVPEKKAIYGMFPDNDGGGASGEMRRESLCLECERESI